MLGDLISAGVKLFSGSEDRKAQEAANERNAALQREFAQNSIRWRAADAKAAGIHPLYAMGAPTISASPSFVGESGFAKGMADASQDIGRAINATRTLPERAAAIEETKLRLDGLKLDNDIKRATVASSLQRIAQANNPPMPSIGADTTEPFKVPEGKKSEERPPLMLWGQRVLTPSGTSPMKAWEDQIGDDGPLSWLAQLAVGAHMMQDNFARRVSGALSSFPAYQKGRDIVRRRYERR